jgi:Flp pilus assembly protein TadB
MSSDSEQTVQLNAEWATSLAEDFLKRLGYKRGLLPKKVSIAGEKYVVEVELKKRTAKVQIDTKTREIREYEIQELPTESGFSLSRRNMFLIFAISGVIVAAVVLKLMNFF